MRRFAALAVAALAAAGPSLAAQDDAPERSASWLQRRLEAGLEKALGGTVRIGRMDVDWTGLSADVGDVAIEIPAEGAPPLTATIASGRIRLAWEGLAGIAGGRIHISDVEAKGATFSLSRAWIDAWRPKPGPEKAGVEVRIDRLTVSGATAVYADEGVHTIVRATDLSLKGDWSTARRSLVAEATTQATVEAPFFKVPWTASVRSGLRLGPGRLEITGATAEGPGVSGELRGNVTWGAGTSFTAEGRVDAELARLLPSLTGPHGLAGHATGPFQIVFVGGAPIKVALQAQTTGFAVGPVTTASAAASLTLRPGRLDVEAIDARAYGGRFTGTVGLAFGQATTLTLDVAGKGADAGAVTALTGKTLPLAAATDLTLALSGDPGRIASWVGRGTFQASPLKGPGTRVPVGGKGTLEFASGRVTLASGNLVSGPSSFALSLVSELGLSPATTHLEVSGTTDDGAATQQDVIRILEALGVGANRIVREPVAGAGSFRTDVRSGASTQFGLGLDLVNGSWSGEPFDHAVLDLAVDPKQIAISRLTVERGQERADGHLRFDAATGHLAEAAIKASGVSIAAVARRFGLTVPVSGRLALDVAGDMIDGAFAAQGTLHAEGIIVGNEIFDTVDAPFVVENGIAHLDPVTVVSHGLEGRLRVAYDLDAARADVDVLEATLDLASSRSLAEAGLVAQGTLRARGPLSIGRDGPSGFLTVSANEFVLDTRKTGVRELRLGDFSGGAELAPSGLTLAVAADPEPVWTFESVLGWSSALPVSAVLYFDDLTVGAGGAFGESADLRLKGQIQADGELTSPKALEVNGAFDDVAVRVGPTTLRSVAAFPLKLDSGQFVLGPSRFEGEGASLNLSAQGSVEGGAFSARLEGRLDLAIVSSFLSDLRGAGPMTIDATVGGTFDRPDLRGRVLVEDGRVRLIGYPQSLEHIDAEAIFEGQTLRLGNFHAALGGGEITATGTTTFTGLTPSSYEATFEVANVSATFPEGFKGTYQGRVKVAGARRGANVTGRIEVVRGLYAREFDLSFTSASHREFGEAGESRFPRNIFLDVDVVAPGNVWIRNDIAKLEIEGSLHVGGEVARPEMTGRISLVPGGTIRYRDVDYRLEYGTLDLTDTRRINPYVDILGTTRVGEYNVTLHVEGTADKFEYELTSLPPLSSQDIISLLVTGKTLDAINASGAAAALPTDMAAYYFAGLLTETFGHTIQSSLGIDQFAITPLLLKGEGDPTARVTVGKRVSDKVKVIFSQDIGTAQKQTYQIVTDVTRRVRLIAESDSESGLGGEVQYSQQFGGAPRTKDAVKASESALPPGPIGSVAVVPTDGPARPDLAKRSKLKAGKPFDRAKMLEGGDRIRAALVKEGFVQSDVRSEPGRDETTGVYNVVYHITPGPRVVVQVVTPDHKKEKSIRKKLRAFWRETPYTPDIWDEASKALLDDLQGDGYYATDIAWHAIDTAAGRTVRFNVDRGKPVRLRSLTFDGVTSLPLSRIESQMESLRKKSLTKRLLRPEVLTQDVGTVRALYRDEGFVQVRVALPQITLAATGDAADVRIAVDEGTRFSVGEIAFQGDAPYGDDILTEWSPLKAGTTFSPRRLAVAEQALHDKLDERGYPDATVDSGVVLGADRADVSFDLGAEGKKTVGAVVFEGNKVTKHRTMAKALTFGEGDPVSRNALLKTQQNLYRTGLFSSVKLTFEPLPGEDPSLQEVRVRVEEAPPWSMGFGLGYDSQDGPRASFLLGYSNLGGRNVGVAFQGLASPNDSRAQVTVRHRRVFHNSIDSLGSLLWERTVQDAFTEWRNSASVRLERRPSPRWIQYIRYTIEDVRIGNDPDAVAAIDEIFADKLSAIRLGSFGLGIVRDSRDDAFSTTRGAYGSIETSVFARPLGSQASFATLFLRGSWTKSFRNGTRFATFLRIGAEQPFGDTDLVPLSERYFAGGASTMRGFSLDSVGGLHFCLVSNPPAPETVVQCQGNDPNVRSFNAGGEALLLVNEEYHFPLWKALHGEVFLDVGNVYPTISDFDPTDVRSDAGLGLRLDTPIGPIRVEYGWKLDRREGESPGEFVFAIGLLF
ncbi:MAG TPA: translocation/assembly module TamB domain-containing protein [Candidatus Polarisedimenticolaceae bacterium]|nr:translocation/assembly module TamB domain-containing protein [Candidatus Polarisedimenticolaceae bacterium]